MAAPKQAASREATTNPTTNGSAPAAADDLRARAQDDAAPARAAAAAAVTPETGGNTTPSDTLFIEPPEKVYSPDFEIGTLSLSELSRSDAVYNRELSWLDFNWRVLYEAMDERTPLLERLRFIAIAASNLDEFFRKRVGGLKRQRAAGLANLTISGWSPELQLELISKKVRLMLEQQSATLIDHIMPALAEHGLHIRHYDDLSQAEQTRMDDYYRREVYPILTPLGVDPGHPFPFISNMSLSLAVVMHDPVSDEEHFARVKVPANRTRWVPLGDGLSFVPLEQIITHNLDEMFTGMEIDAAYPFRVTRNADIARNEDEADDLLDFINEELRERRFAPVVRLEVDEAMPRKVRNLLVQELHVDQQDVYPVRGWLRQGDFFDLGDVNLPHLKYEPWTPLTPPRFAGLNGRQRPAEIFALIRQGDLLLHHPYHSFAATTQQFIEAAANDPQVLAIKQTIYRTSADSPIANALMYAAERGKQVAVLVELKARFDEERNIDWARTLENAGCHVAYGLVGLKTHAKLSLAIRQEEDGLRAYYHIGTGNYNPKTANLYTDLGLLSCEPERGQDIMDLFNFLTGYSRQRHYRKLLVAPVNMRQHFLELLDNEIANALAGRRAHVLLKMNGLDDVTITEKLYEAAQAGVQIDLIVRGVCRVRPGIPGVSESIRVISVIGRFLEHSRLFYFANQSSESEEPLVYMGSADWMSRNLSARVEAITPIEEKRLRDYVINILQLMLADQRQTWEMLPDGRYRKLAPPQREGDPSEKQAPVDGTHEVLMEQTQRNVWHFEAEG